MRWSTNTLGIIPWELRKCNLSFCGNPVIRIRFTCRLGPCVGQCILTRGEGGSTNHSDHPINQILYLFPYILSCRTLYGSDISYINPLQTTNSRRVWTIALLFHVNSNSHFIECWLWPRRVPLCS